MRLGSNFGSPLIVSLLLMRSTKFMTSWSVPVKGVKVIDAVNMTELYPWGRGRLDTLGMQQTMDLRTEI